MKALTLYAHYLDEKHGNELAKQVVKNNHYLAKTNKGSQRNAEIFQNLEVIEASRSKSKGFSK